MVIEFKKMLEDMPVASTKQLTNTLAHIFRHDYKENFISDWLAFLINPTYMGSTEPLEKLLYLSKVDNLDINLAEEIEIEREYTFEDGRRIDFLIRAQDCIIAIENKIWSGLQKDQLKDYSKQIKKICKKEKKLKSYCIFLCPLKNQIYKEKEYTQFYDFELVTYEELVEEFKSVRLNCITNLRAALLMQDFITHMEEYIMKESSSNIVDFKMLKFGYEYSKQIKKLENQAKNNKDSFARMLKEKMLETMFDEKWETNSNNSSYYHQLFKSNWNTDYQVHFELIHENILSPSEIRVVLHTREKIKDKPQLNILQDEFKKYLEEKYGTDKFSVSYINEEDFKTSINKIMTTLKDAVLNFESKIDEAIKSL